MAKRESGMQLFARLGTRPCIQCIEAALFSDGPCSRDVVELYGGEGTGKTEILLHITVRCLLPKDWDGLQLDGFEAGIIYIDTDYKFSILRLATLIEQHILNKTNEYNTKPSSTDIETLIKGCLKRLHVIRCNSSSQLAVSLHSLETLLCNDPSISVIMIDSVSAFYWVDKCYGGDSVAAQETNMRQIVDTLSKLINTYNLVAFATKAALYKKKFKGGIADFDVVAEGQKTASGSNEVEHVEYLCKSWQKLVTHRLVLSKSSSLENKRQKFTVVIEPGNSHDSIVQFYISENGLNFMKH